MNIKKKILKKHFIFDLDGVLFDSIYNMQLSWNIVNKKFNLNVPFSQYKKYIGLPFYSILNKLKIKNNQKLISKEYFHQSKKNISKIKIFSGVKKTLKRLKQNNKIISIVTSKKRSNALILVKKLNINFDYIKTENKTLRGKPYPDLINFCIIKSKIKKKYCLYLGDMKVDYSTAKRAGIDFLLAQYGYGKLSKPCKKITNFSSLLKFYE
jgi:phosphoglycolate phosphatase